MSWSLKKNRGDGWVQHHSPAQILPSGILLSDKNWKDSSVNSLHQLADRGREQISGKPGRSFNVMSSSCQHYFDSLEQFVFCWGKKKKQLLFRSIEILCQCNRLHWLQEGFKQNKQTHKHKSELFMPQKYSQCVKTFRMSTNILTDFILPPIFFLSLTSEHQKLRTGGKQLYKSSWTSSLSALPLCGVGPSGTEK